MLASTSVYRSECNGYLIDDWELSTVVERERLCIEFRGHRDIPLVDNGGTVALCPANHVKDQLGTGLAVAAIATDNPLLIACNQNEITVGEGQCAWKRRR